MNAATHPAWTTPGGAQGTVTPTRRQRAEQIAAEHAAAGRPISASKANRLAVRAIAAEVDADPDTRKRINYRDETGDTAVWNVLSGGGVRA